MEKTFYEMIGVSKDEWALNVKYLDSNIVSFLESCFDGGFDGKFVGTDVTKFNKLVRLIKISLKATGFFEHFPSYSEEQVLEEFSLLPAKYVHLFIQAYGEDLKHPICRVNLSNADRRKVDNSFSFIKRRIAGINNRYHPSKNIFELFSSYSEEEIWDAFYRMPDHYQKFLTRAYGEGLNDSSLRNSLDESEKYKVKKIVYTIFAKRLKNKNLGKTSSRAKNIFELFPSYSEEAIWEAFESLSDYNKGLLQRAYGEDLSDSTCRDSLSLSDRSRVYDVVRGAFYRRLSTPSFYRSKNSQNVFEYFSNYSEKEIWNAFNKLPLKSQDLLRRAYGEDLSDSSGVKSLNSDEKRAVDRILKGSLRKFLRDASLVSKKASGQLKHFFDYFSFYKKEDVVNIFSSLSSEEKALIVKLYGENFDDICTDFVACDEEMLNAVIRKMRVNLYSVCNQKNIYEYFSDYSCDDVYVAFLSLSFSNRKLLVRAYGEDLSDSSLFSKLSYDERKSVHRIIIDLFSKRVASLDSAGKDRIKTVFEILHEYSRNDIFSVFDQLDDVDKNFVISFYGTSLEDIGNFDKFSFDERKKVYHIVLDKIGSTLKAKSKSLSPKKRGGASKKSSSVKSKPSKKSSTAVKSSSPKPRVEIRQKPVHLGIRRPSLNRGEATITSSVVRDTLSRKPYRKLSVEEEIWYVKKAKLSYYSSEIDDSVRQKYLDYYCEVTPRFKRKYDNASPSRKQALLDEAIRDSKEWRDEFLGNNLRLITKLISVLNFESSIDDIFQEGFTGMMRALAKFDVERNIKFSTYAFRWIRQAISRYVSTRTKTVKIPLYFSENVKKFNAVRGRLYQVLQREPTIGEIALELDMPEEDVELMMDYCFQLSDIESLDVPILDDESASLHDILSTGSDFTSDFLNSEQLKFIKKVIETSDLDSLQILVLYLSLGILDGISYSPSEISEKLKISVEACRNTYALALKKLRRNVRLYQILSGEDISVNFESDISLADTWEYIEMSLDSLSFKIFVMVYVQDMDIYEVSDKLGILFDDAFDMSIKALKVARRCALNIKEKPQKLI